MLRDERQKKIYNILMRDGFVEINYLCRMFRVADMTIRRDLDTLSQEYDIVRMHGGAMLEINKAEEPPYESRMVSNSGRKEEIAAKAVSLIKEGQTIFLDSGTTTLFVARRMSNENHNTVVTNGINIVETILNLEGVSVLLIGGDIKKNTHSTRGSLAEEQMGKFKFDIAFIGADAVGEDGSLYVGNTAETGMKKSAVRAAARIYGLVDSSKFNSYKLLSYAHGSELTGIITDNGLPEETKKSLEDRGIHIIVAE